MGMKWRCCRDRLSLLLPQINYAVTIGVCLIWELISLARQMALLLANMPCDVTIRTADIFPRNYEALITQYILSYVRCPKAHLLSKRSWRSTSYYMWGPRIETWYYVPYFVLEAFRKEILSKMFVLASELTSACPHVMIRELLKDFSRSGTFITITVLAKVEQRTDVLLESVYVLLISYWS